MSKPKDAIKPTRKPRPFNIKRRAVAVCVEHGVVRWMYLHGYDGDFAPSDARRLSQWLADAADWVEEGL